MQLPPPEGTDPPSWGQLIVYIFYGIGTAVAVILGGRGFIRGREAPAPAATDHELVGALIDSKKADEIVKAMETQTLAIANAAASSKAMAEAIDRNTDIIERATGQIREARDEIRDLTIEIARAGKR